jgi:L-2,4-diaminobutyrate decarboxylase
MSNPIMDGYFIHTISHFLDHVDSLKCVAPVLGMELEKCSECTFHNVNKDSLPMLPTTKQEAESENTRTENFPDEMSTVEAVTELLSDYCKYMTIWAHPNAQINVTPSSTIPSIIAFIAATIYNPNLVWDEHSALFAKAELQTIATISDLIGYDPQQSGGLFTFGGTGTILYGCKMGVEKMFGGQTMAEGIREDVKIVASASSHYSRLNVASWLGVGTKNLVTIPITRDNEMSLIDFEEYLRQAFEAREKVAVILATLGTTEAFGIDDLAAIIQLRDKLADEYELEHPPHVHADAVIGWAWTVFKNYDFKNNPLGFHARTLRSLQDSLLRISSINMADSIGIDFHKTGYAPYISSLFLVKNRADLTLLSRVPEQMPYLYQYGYYHPGIYTLETSRPGTGPLAALANIQLLGKRGYRVLIGHVVEMAEMLREGLESQPFICVLNDHNYGPVTLFRVYPEGIDGRQAFQLELTDPDYGEQLKEHNAYNRRIFKKIHERAMRGEGVLLSWTDAYRHADYKGGSSVAALKSFIMSPWTDLNAVDTVVRQVQEARIRLSEESN